MTNIQPSLEEVIAAMKAECYTPEDAAKLSVVYEGNKVEFEGEIWYEITTADGSGSYTAWCTILDGFTMYDGDKIDQSDRISEIDDLIAARR